MSDVPHKHRWILAMRDEFTGPVEQVECGDCGFVPIQPEPLLDDAEEIDDIEPVA